MCLWHASTLRLAGSIQHTEVQARHSSMQFVHSSSIIAQIVCCDAMPLHFNVLGKYSTFKFWFVDWTHIIVANIYMYMMFKFIMCTCPNCLHFNSFCNGCCPIYHYSLELINGNFSLNPNLCLMCDGPPFVRDAFCLPLLLMARDIFIPVSSHSVPFI